MTLYQINDFDPNYHDSLGGNDIKGLSVYTEKTDEKIGTVSDILVDEQGHFRYLVVDLGLWIFGKKVLLPIGRTRIDQNASRVYAVSLTRQQAEDLPEFNKDFIPDYNYEEQVRGIYRDSQYQTQPETVTPVTATPAPATATPTYSSDVYSYEQEPSLYSLNQPEQQILKLYEERLIANKRRQKTGEVVIGKHVETETTRVAIPLEKERVVIEHMTPTDSQTVVPAGEADFREGEVARMEIYEETPDIHKETFLREEVKVKKVVDRDTIETQGTVRREELDVSAPGLPIEEH